jgi:hypothetical protein
LLQLEHTRASPDRAGGGLGAEAPVHRNREIDDGDVDLRSANDIRDLVARLGAEALDAEAVEEYGQLVRKGVPRHPP